MLSISSLKKQFQPHPYHMVDVSPWPLLTSFAVLTIMISAVLYFNNLQNSGILLVMGLARTFFAFVLWFRDITTEGTYLGDHTLIVQKGLTMGVALFIVTEAFFFLTIFWRYFHSSLSPTVELGSHWPPAGIEALNPFAIPLLNTILLLSSGATVTYAHHALIEGDRKATLLGTAMTLVFAILFTALQGVEYVNAGFTIADGAYGSCFFFGTGLLKSWSINIIADICL